MTLGWLEHPPSSVIMVSTGRGRHGRPWWRMVALVFREEDRCWLCGRRVDHTLPGNHRLGHTVDHLVQLDHLDEGTQWLALDRSNLRLAHRGCNSARGNRLRLTPIDRCACRAGLACGPMARPGGGPVVSMSVPLSEI